MAQDRTVDKSGPNLTDKLRGDQVWFDEKISMKPAQVEAFKNGSYQLTQAQINNVMSLAGEISEDLLKRGAHLDQTQIGALKDAQQLAALDGNKDQLSQVELASYVMAASIMKGGGHGIAQKFDFDGLDPEALKVMAQKIYETNKINFAEHKAADNIIGNVPPANHPLRMMNDLPSSPAADALKNILLKGPPQATDAATPQQLAILDTLGVPQSYRHYVDFSKGDFLPPVQNDTGRRAIFGGTDVKASGFYHPENQDKPGTVTLGQGNQMVGLVGVLPLNQDIFPGKIGVYIQDASEKTHKANSIAPAGQPVIFAMPVEDAKRLFLQSLDKGASLNKQIDEKYKIPVSSPEPKNQRASVEGAKSDEVYAAWRKEPVEGPSEPFSVNGPNGQLSKMFAAVQKADQNVTISPVPPSPDIDSQPDTPALKNQAFGLS